MKTITIEVDVPDNFTELEIDNLKDAAHRLVSPDWLAVWWHSYDVSTCANKNRQDYEGVTKAEAREVLKMADKNHDSNSGINWTVLLNYIDEVVSKREEII